MDHSSGFVLSPCKHISKACKCTFIRCLIFVWNAWWKDTGFTSGWSSSSSPRQEIQPEITFETPVWESRLYFIAKHLWIFFPGLGFERMKIMVLKYAEVLNNYESKSYFRSCQWTKSKMRWNLSCFQEISPKHLYFHRVYLHLCITWFHIF